MKKLFVLFFILITARIAYSQTDTTGTGFPVSQISSYLFAKDSVFLPPKYQTRVYPSRYDRGYFSHIIYHIKITFMLEMGRDWIKPFWVMTEAPDGKREAFWLNTEEYYSPGEDYFYYNINIPSHSEGLARIWLGEEKGNTDYYYLPALSTTFYLH